MTLRKLTQAAVAVSLFALLGACGARIEGDANVTPSCTRTFDGASISVTMPGGRRYACDTVAQGDAPLDVNATIVSVGTESFQVDTCPPNADCAGTIATVSVAAKGLDLPHALPIGTQVRIRASVSRFFACQRELHVTTLASWGGLANPFGAGDVVLLDVIDGGAPASDAPFELGIMALGCVSKDVQGCGGARVPDDYAFSFAPKAAGATPVAVRMGETKPLPLGGTALGTWAVRNLRSYESGACDDSWNWSYWLAYQSPVK